MTSAEQAHLAVNQGIAVMRNHYDAQVRENKRLSARITQLENRGYDREYLEAGGLPYVRELQAKIAELQTTERRLREYMRLKDNAKIKVEKTRDYWKRTAEAQQSTINTLRTQRLDVQAMEEANAVQARAYKDKEEQCASWQRKARDLQSRLDNVMQIMQNAVDGVRSDNPYGQWRPWPEAIPHTTWIDGRDVQGH